MQRSCWILCFDFLNSFIPQKVGTSDSLEILGLQKVRCLLDIGTRLVNIIKQSA